MRSTHPTVTGVEVCGSARNLSAECPMKLDNLQNSKVASAVVRWFHIVIAVGPIPFYRSALPWQYWICVVLFLLLWVEIGPGSGAISKLQASLAQAHAGLAWATCITAFLGCVSFGWMRETEVSVKLMVATIILYVVGLLDGSKNDDSK